MTVGQKPRIKPEVRKRPAHRVGIDDGRICISYQVDGTDYQIGGYRVNPKAYQRMREIDKMTDIRDALEAIIDLCQNYTRFEELDPSIYAGGKLTKVPKLETLRWNKCSDDDNMFPGRFKPEVFVGSNCSYSLPFSEPNLARNVIKAIQTEPILLTMNIGKYVFMYGEREHDPNYYCSGHIIFRRVRELT